MCNTNVPYLCGGTFFALLVSRKKKYKEPDTIDRRSKQLPDWEIMKKLVTMVSGSDYVSENSLKPTTNNYKKCKSNGGAIIPFEDEETAGQFVKRLNENYDTHLSQITDIIKEYIIENEIDSLIKAYLELIEKDSSINDYELFYIRHNNVAVSKAELRTISEIEVQPFMLGILRYITESRRDNTLGRATYDMWHKEPKVANTQYEFISDIGSGIKENITIRMAGTDDVKEYNCSAGKETSDQTDRGKFIIDRKLNSDFYNIFVIGGETFEKNRFIVDAGRAYIPDDIKKRLAECDAETIENIKSYPSLFMAENKVSTGNQWRTDPNQMAVFGLVEDIKVQDNGIKIYLRKMCEIPQQTINDLCVELDLGNGRGLSILKHTHWAVKRINLIEVLEDAGIKLPVEI